MKQAIAYKYQQIFRGGCTKAARSKGPKKFNQPVVLVCDSASASLA